MRAVALNCSLKASPEPSNTQALANVVLEALKGHGVETTTFRLADLSIPPGVESDLGAGDDWPQIRAAIVSAEILLVLTPTWVGRPSSLAQRALERMDAMLSETDDQGRPVAYNRVAGVVVTGNEDGAHHVISEVSGALVDIGSPCRGSRGRTGTRVRAPGRAIRTPARGGTGRTRPGASPRRTWWPWPAPWPRRRSRPHSPDWSAPFSCQDSCFAGTKGT